MNDANKPDFQSDSFAAFIPLWNKVDACLGGTEAMRAAGETYLPQFPMEADSVYAHRLATATFFPAYSDTLNGVTGTIFRKPIRLGENVSPSIAVDAENIDLAGTHFEVFGQRLFKTGVHHGLSYILVDMPRRPEGVFDAAQAQAINFRPFWILYSARELQNWPRYVIIDGAPVLQQIVFREESVEPDGFGEESVVRYRVWRVPVLKDDLGNYRRTGNAEWEIWEEREENDGKTKTKGVVIVDAGVSPLPDIPVAPFNANPCLTSPQRTDGPVLLDLANLNIKHWQMVSDHEHALHTCSPTAFTVNLRQDGDGGNSGIVEQVPYGNGVRWDMDEGGSAGFAEPSGSGLAERREWIDGLKEQMLELGLSLAQENSQKQGGAMTATEAMLKGGTRASRLTQLARAFQDCFEVALGFTAQWKGEESGGEITLGVKDADLVMSAQDLATVSAMVELNQHSLEYLWALEARAGYHPDDFNAETEKQLIEQQVKLKMERMPEVEPVEAQGERLDDDQQ